MEVRNTVDNTHPIQATCPLCRGPLSETVKTDGDRKLVELKCLVGHCFSPRALLEAHSQVEETVLWSAVVALEEASILVDAVTSQFTPQIAQRLRDQCLLKKRQALDIRTILEHLEPFETESTD